MSGALTYYLAFTMLAAAAMGFMLAAYAFGGDAWNDRFKLVVKQGETKKIHPGWIAEFCVAGLVVSMCVAADLLTPDISLDSIEREHRPKIVIATLGVIVWVTLYSIYIILRAKHREGHDAHYVRELITGYTLYAPFSIFVYFVIALIVFLIALQIPIDYERVRSSIGNMDELLARIPAQDIVEVGSARVQLELAFGELNKSFSYTASQMNTYFIFLIFAFCINIALSYTPIGGAFDESARNLARWVSIALTCMISAAALYVYVGQYSGSIDRFLAVVIRLNQPGMSEDPLFIQRLNEYVEGLSDRQSIVAFVFTQARDSVGLASFLALLQWFVPKQMNGYSTLLNQQDLAAHGRR